MKNQDVPTSRPGEQELVAEEGAEKGGGGGRRLHLQVPSPIGEKIKLAFCTTPIRP